MQWIWTGAYLGALYSLSAWAIRYIGFITGTFQPASYAEWAHATSLHPTVDSINSLVVGLIAGAIVGAIVERIVKSIQRIGSEATVTATARELGITLALGVATIVFAALIFTASFFAAAHIAALQPPL